ncbi:ArsR/SmtB family transcription factor [Streptomyces niveus]|uniref:ArsR/SmtB family transcription factor n=1 Tax=Streptomyces niveus TaxID=193462 RepID=UPI0033C0DBAE
MFRARRTPTCGCRAAGYCSYRPSSGRAPLALVDNADPERPLVLRYPVALDLADHRALWAQPAPTGPDGGLAALLGTTRARVLRAVENTASTSELALRTGISDATASHHASVLRAARLVTTRREGSGVRHELTPLGRGLLGHLGNPQAGLPASRRTDRDTAS